MALVQEPFDFQSLFAHAVRFVPVDFSGPDVAILQTDPSLAFEFPPAASAVLSAKTGQISDAAAGAVAPPTGGRPPGPTLAHRPDGLA